MKRIIYNKYINCLLRSILKEFSRFLPTNFKFPINGIFKVKGNDIPPFYISTNPTSCVTKKVFWDNVEGFEFNSARIFCELIKKSNVFFDIGANIGYYSLLASSIRGKDVLVCAFEPMPSAYSYLQENIKINGFDNIKPFELALSNQKGKATFYSIVNEKFKSYPQLTGDGGLSKTQSGNRAKINFDVETNTLDDFVNEIIGDNKVDLIKLDTEANEHFVLMGANNVLKNHRPIIQCEILKNQIENELEVILSNYDYLYYRATDKGLEHTLSFVNNPSEFVDYYLIPREKKYFVENFIIKNN